MTVLKIYSLDDEEEKAIISALTEGEHIIGRDKLNCKDKRISRNHALFIISENKVLLKSTHINPSFYKPNGGNSIKLVKKDESVIISDGDRFAFLADAFWFKTRIVETKHQMESTKNTKRIHDESDVEDKTKKARFKDASPETNVKDSYLKGGSVSDSEDSLDFADSILNDNLSKENSGEKLTTDPLKDSELNDKDFPVSNELNKKESEKNNKYEDTSHNANTVKESYIKGGSTGTDEENINKPKKDVSDSEDSLDFANSILKDNAPREDSNKNVTTESLKGNEPGNRDELVSNKLNEKEFEENEKENDSNEKTETNVTDPSTSTKSKRTSCWYGATCYRKNPIHKEEYSHPGDSDYEDIPDCPFGSTCYRRNILHRKQYKHTNPPATKPSPAPNTGNNSDQDSEDESDNSTPQGKRKRKAATKVTKYAESPEDDYDLQDPFINDASSDDFELTDDNDESDSDWQDSQEVEEDTQERKRLLKEAKKFAKKKNK